MVDIPREACESTRLAAIQRRITACRATAKVLTCGKQELAAARFLREAEALEAEQQALLAGHSRIA